jgi:zinc protease
MLQKINKILFCCIIVLSVQLGLAQQTESFTVNGLKVIFKQNTSTDIIAAQMYFKGGVALLEPEKAGLESLTLQVAIDASKNYPEDVLSSKLASMNSQLSASSGLDYSSINLLCVKQFFDDSWKIFSDVIVNPSFTNEDFQIEKGQQINGVKQSQDNPDRYLNHLVADAFYNNHPYRIEVYGNEATLNSFSLEQIKEYYKNRLQTSGMLLVIVGNISKEELEKRIKESFGDIPVGDFVQPQLPAVEHSETSLKLVDRNLPTVYIEGVFPAPKFASDDYYPMAVATSILHDRLFEEVRTKRSLSYAPAAWTNGSFSNSGAIYVTTVYPDSTINVMLNELNKIKDEPIPAQELANKVNTFVTRYYMRNETFSQQASLLARYELSGAGYKDTDKYLSFVKKVSSEDIQKVTKEYIKNLQYVLIGNPSSLEVKSFIY